MSPALPLCLARTASSVVSYVRGCRSACVAMDIDTFKYLECRCLSSHMGLFDAIGDAFGCEATDQGIDRTRAGAPPPLGYRGKSKALAMGRSLNLGYTGISVHG